MNIHWLGNGLSSVPGIRYLANRHDSFALWCRRPDVGRRLVDGCRSQDVRHIDGLAAAVAAGDVVVSMLPVSEHLKVATLCLEKGAHFVSSSYVSDEMRGLDAAAAGKGLTFLNEVGLDPGLDHLLAHDVIESFKASDLADRAGELTHSIRSYCGGFPKSPNEFRYKFSWSPVGVLRALKTPASWIEDGETKHTPRPWTALSEYHAPIPGRERFQAYPNRDSIPFIQQYHIPEDWPLGEFVRGTLRLDGWAVAWKEVFATIEDAPSEATAA